MKDARNAPVIVVRAPDDLRDWLKHQAIDNRRSLSGEVLHRLERSREQEAGSTVGKQLEAATQ